MEIFERALFMHSNGNRRRVFDTNHGYFEIKHYEDRQPTHVLGVRVYEGRFFIAYWDFSQYDGHMVHYLPWAYATSRDVLTAMLAISDCLLFA